MLEHTWTLYHTDTILNELNLTLKSLVEIIVLSGSDYTPGTKKPLPPVKSLKYILDVYRSKMEDKTECVVNVYEFYSHLYSNEQIMNEESFEKYCNLFEMHILQELLEPIPAIYNQKNNEVKLNIQEIHKIMEPHGFIFIQ
jgi:hypothetical protein